MKFRRQQVHWIVVACLTAAMGIGVARSDGQDQPAAATAQSVPAVAPAATDAAADTKVVLRVGKDEVTKADIEFLISGLSPQVQQAVASRGRQAVGEQYAVLLLLSQHALDDHIDSTPAVRERLALEKLQMLAQAEYQKMESQVQVTPEEVGQYFTAHKDDFDEVKIREIIVRKKTADDKPDAPGLPADQAQARIDGIRKALTAGTEVAKVEKDFGVPNVVMIDSEPRSIRRGQLLPDLDKEAFSLKDGQLSEPFQMPQAIVMLQVVGHQPADLKSVSSQIESDLKQQKLDSAINDMKKSANIWMDDDYFKAGSTPAQPAPEKPTPPAPPKP